MAILSDCTSNQYFINFIVSKTLIDVKAAVSILKCFAKFNKKSQAEKIKMVELMGAAYSFPLRGVRELEGIYLGIHCWIFALKLRDLHSALSSNSSFLKTPTILSESAQKVFGRTTEFRTLEELHANRYQRNSVMLFQTQALLVIQRITSQIDPDPNTFFLHCLCRFLISKSSKFKPILIGCHVAYSGAPTLSSVERRNRLRLVRKYCIRRPQSHQEFSLAE